jgi:hypothetical protein
MRIQEHNLYTTAIQSHKDYTRCGSKTLSTRLGRIRPARRDNSQEHGNQEGLPVISTGSMTGRTSATGTDHLRGDGATRRPGR